MILLVHSEAQSSFPNVANALMDEKKMTLNTLAPRRARFTNMSHDFFTAVKTLPDMNTDLQEKKTARERKQQQHLAAFSVAK